MGVDAMGVGVMGVDVMRVDVMGGRRNGSRRTLFFLYETTSAPSPESFLNFFCFLLFKLTIEQKNLL